MSDYIQYIMSDSVIKDYVTSLCSYYAMIVILDYSLKYAKRFTIKQNTVLYQQQPHTAHAYPIS
jgi:hypothetical protein